MRFRILTVLTAALFLMSGCGSAGTESEPAKESIIVYQALPLPEIYMDIPERFTITSSQFYEEYYICDDASIIVTEDTNGPFSSLNDYAVSALLQYQGIANTLDVTAQEQIPAKNCDVYILEFDYTLGEDNSLQKSCMVGFASDGSTMFIITCKSDTSSYASYRTEFSTVMESVMLTKTGR